MLANRIHGPGGPDALRPADTQQPEPVGEWAMSGAARCAPYCPTSARTGSARIANRFPLRDAAVAHALMADRSVPGNLLLMDSFGGDACAT